jgi:hypothetical protein
MMARYFTASRELAFALEGGDESAWTDARQAVDIVEAGPAQQVAAGGKDAGRIGVGDWPAARQRHLAHGAQDGVTVVVVDRPHPRSIPAEGPSFNRLSQRSGSRMLT